MRRTVGLLAETSGDEDHCRVSSRLVEVCSRIGDTAVARELGDQVEASLPTLPLPWPRFNALLDWAETLAFLGEHSRMLAAVEAAGSIGGAGAAEHDLLMSEQKRRLAEVLAQVGEYSSALTIARGIPRERQKADALTAVASFLTEKLGPDAGAPVAREAIALASSAMSDHDRAIALAHAGAVLHAASPGDGAAVVREAAGVVGCILDRRSRGNAELVVLRALQQIGANPEALTLWRSMLRDDRAIGRGLVLIDVAAGASLVAEAFGIQALESLRDRLVASERWWGVITQAPQSGADAAIAGNGSSGSQVRPEKPPGM
jgi:hypothetical protein